MKEFKWNNFLSAAAYVIVGIILLFFPQVTAEIMGYTVGAILILFGALCMINYLLRDAFTNYYKNDFLLGLAAICLGIFVLLRVDLFIALIPFVLGLMVMISGCSKLQDVIDMKRIGYGNWIVMLVLALINIFFGIFLLFRAYVAALMIFRLIGAGLLFSGVTDGVIIMVFCGKVKKLIKERKAEKG